ncbi:MAG: ribonuclease [Pseudomonadota bacterium]
MPASMCERRVVAGIGETRICDMEDGRIIEAAIDRGDAFRHGTCHAARLVKRLAAGGAEARVGERTVLLDRWPSGATAGQRVDIRIVREPVPERGRMRDAKGAVIDPGERIADISSERAEAETETARPALDPDDWDLLIEEARTGIVAFSGGLLSIVPTPAGTTIDVDGALAPDDLAVRGAMAAGHAIRRLGIAGSILIDLPSVEGKTARNAAAAALDEALPPPFERTGVNGFGLLQVIRPRRRPSILEWVQNRPVDSAALDLLRRAERSGATGRAPRPIRNMELRAGDAVITWLEARRELTAELARRTAATIRLVRHGDDALWWGDVHAL